MFLLAFTLSAKISPLVSIKFILRRLPKVMYTFMKTKQVKVAIGLLMQVSNLL